LRDCGHRQVLFDIQTSQSAHVDLDIGGWPHSPPFAARPPPSMSNLSDTHAAACRISDENARSVHLRSPGSVRVASTDTENARDFARHPDTDAALTPPR